jgi:hypothetical protein
MYGVRRQAKRDAALESAWVSERIHAPEQPSLELHPFHRFVILPHMAAIPNIIQATRRYELWLASHVRVLEKDLCLKHHLMAQDPFSFFRATFYRWMQLFPESCPKADRAPRLLAVGDLHVANFGTWRDAEGRLIWGINDFDEAFPLPYTLDLIRLATSASIAIKIGHLSSSSVGACEAILDGYSEALKSGGEPFVLSEKHPFLRDTATSRLRDPKLFWGKFAALPTIRSVPTKVFLILKRAMPEPKLPFRVAHRQAGLGSLGRERFTAIADWRGGKIAREIKPLLPSACAWGSNSRDKKIYYRQIVTSAIRAPDPFLAIKDGWVLRRLSPFCSRIDLSQLPRTGDAERLFHAMGWELANVHLGSKRTATNLRRDLSQRKSNWLCHATEVMTNATLKDWKEWRKTNK